jgi:soluble lytic murein transglycosylase-like protein
MSKLITVILAAFITIGFAYYRPVEVREIEKIIEVPAQELPFNVHLEGAARAYGVHLFIAQAMVHQESGGKMAAIRHEPGQMERAKKLTKASGEQLRMFASSHCALQILGWHAPTYGLTWADLYNPQTCAEVGMHILSKCLERHKGKPPVAQLKEGLTCYNGSETYARIIMARVGEQLLGQYLSNGF